jgi:hypothetical protein
MKNFYQKRPYMVLFTIAFLSSSLARASVIVSKAVTGGWSSTTTWVAGVVPASTDSVVIVSGASISTGTNQSCGAVNIMGTLTLTGGNYLTVAGDGVTSFGSVAGNGVLGYSSIGNRNILLTGDYTFNGTSGNSGQNITFNGTENQMLSGVISTGTGGSGIVNINKTSGQVILQGVMTFANLGLKIISGTFNPNGYLSTITTLNPAGGMIIVDAASFTSDYSATTVSIPSPGNTFQYTAASPTINSAITYQNLTFSGSGAASSDGALTIQGSLLNNGGGSLNFGTNNVTLSGTVSSSSIAGFITTGTLSMTKTAGTAILTGSLTSGPLLLNGNGGTFNLGTALSHNVTNVTMTKGTLNGGSSTLTLSGAWSGTGATFAASTGTVNYNGSAPQIISTAPTYYNISFSVPGQATLATTPLNVTANLILSSGTTLVTSGIPSSYILNVGGNWTNNGGTFNNTNNTVVLNGSSLQNIGGSQSTSFYNLTISNTGGNAVLAASVNVAHQLSFVTGSIDATNASLTLPSSASAVTGASSSSYVITGNGITTTGSLSINNLPTNTPTAFPIGTASYYLPVTVNPGTSSSQSYSAFVYQGATTSGSSNGTLFNASELQGMVNAVWNISQTAGSGSATLSLNWINSGTGLEGSSLQVAGTNIGISQFSGGSWQLPAGSGSAVTETAAASISSFSQFAVGIGGVILAEMLTDFNATQTGSLITLTWQSTFDSATDFQVQKNAGIDSWITLGDVNAEAGGTSAGRYSFVDNYPTPGVNEFRIRIRDVDGIWTYSTICIVNIGTFDRFQIYPNPANTYVQVKSSVPGQLRISNFAGQTLKVVLFYGTNPANLESLNMEAYPSGPYLFEFTDNQGKRTAQEVVLQRL